MAVDARWLFRSRSTRRLTGLTFVVIAVGMSALASLVLTPYLQRLKGSNDNFDWLVAEQPAILDDTRITEGFLRNLRELVANLQHEPAQRAAGGQLVRVSRDEPIHVTKPPCSLTTASLYGDIPVFPTCTTYSKKAEPTPEPKRAEPTAGSTTAELTATEMQVFQRFSTYTQKLYGRMKTSRSNASDLTDNFEAVLSREFGQFELEGGSRTFNTPWLYVASVGGAIAVFPGTGVIGYDRWDIKGRPWFMASLGRDTKLANSVHEDGDQLTVTYLDVLGESPLHVRTYLRNFTVGNEQFVIGIDLHRQPIAPGSMVPRSWQDLADPSYLPVVAAGLLAFAGLQAATVRRDIRIRYEGAEPRYGVVVTDVKEEVKINRDALKWGWVGTLRGWFTASSSTEIIDDSTNKSTTSQSRTVRGFQVWNVSKIVTDSWRCVATFESRWREPIGTLRLEYSSAVRPHVYWYPFAAVSLPDAERVRLQKELPALLAAAADRVENQLEVSDADLATMRNGSIPAPEWIRPFLTPDDAVAIQYRRAYATLSGVQLAELYKKAKVQAVVLATYLSHLLEAADTSFLTNGKTIHRLISFQSPDAELTLSGGARAQLASLLQDFGNSRNRRIQRVDVPISGEGELQPIYDFAILDFSDEGGGKIIVVAKFVSQSISIDSVSGKSARPQYVVEGYVSWRPADVAFYCEFFERLAKLARPLEAPQSPIVDGDGD